MPLKREPNIAPIEWISDMARPQHLYVFAYDIERDASRSKVADILSEKLVRVQFSVFEGRLTRGEAETLAKEAALRIGPDDSLRCYCIPEAGRRLSFTHGGPPIAEAGDFWLL
jgi:CRISPR-associated protein Cas2